MLAFFHREDTVCGNARLLFQLDVSQFNMIVTIRFFYGWSFSLRKRKQARGVKSQHSQNCIAKGTALPDCLWRHALEGL